MLPSNAASCVGCSRRRSPPCRRSSSRSWCCVISKAWPGPRSVTSWASRAPTSGCYFTARARSFARASSATSGDQAMSEPELTCKEVVELVNDYLGATMPAAERARFADHLAECPACPSHLEQMQTMSELTGQLRED